MKYLKTFEVRKPAYKHLSEENAEIIEMVVRKFLSEKDIPEIINDLHFNYFVSYHFDYFDIFCYKMCSNREGTYHYGNVYYVIDTYMIDNHISATTPEVRNTLHNILKKLYKELNIKSQLDKKLIEILEKHPDKYKARYEAHGDEFSKVVKDACKWMLDAEKYNL